MSKHLLQMEQDLRSLRRANNRSNHRQIRVRALDMNGTGADVSNSSMPALLELEQKLLGRRPLSPRKPARKRVGPAQQRVQAQAFDYDEPIELCYDDAFYASGSEMGVPATIQQALPPMAQETVSFEVEPFDGKIYTHHPDAAIAEPAGETPTLSDRPVVISAAPVAAQASEPARADEANWAELEKMLDSSSGTAPEMDRASDSDEFEGELRAILSGAKSVEPEARPPVRPPALQQMSSPEGSPHAIFDQMGRNLAHATTFNLGPVELERRFDAFDHVMEQGEQRVRARTALSAPAAAVKASATRAADEPLELDRMDLIEDFVIMSERKPQTATPSGADWLARFPGSKSLDDLAPDLGDKVKSFIKALEDGGASVDVTSTRRPRERAYLMHWAWRIAKQDYDPQKVPSMDGVNIEWWHGDAATSRQAAQEMVDGYKINDNETPPARDSRHIQGKAIDMIITWNDGLSIKKADGSVQVITSEPRDGTNAELIEVGKSYGVVHSPAVSKHKVHWSTDGR